MGSKTETGFTIIEAMLFLSVTGLLAVGVLVGSGVAIGQQRYRDSVNTLKSYIQDQYNQTTNVVNDRNQAWTCNNLADISQETNPLGGQPRGTSECVILGRFITVDTTGTKLTASNVVGYHHTGAANASSDIAELTTNYTLGISPINQDTEDVNWGAQVVKPKTTTPMPFSLLIVRSPLSGSILTFSAEGVQTNVNTLINAANMSQQHDLCLNADVGSFVGRRMEVQIAPYATSQSAVQIPVESGSVCD